MRRRKIRRAATNHRCETVLLVSVDPTRREQLCRSVGSCYPVLLADSFPHAMRLARKVRPSVICVDCVHSQNSETRILAQQLHLLAVRLTIPVVLVGTASSDLDGARPGNCHICAARAGCTTEPRGIPSVSALCSSVEEACAGTVRRPTAIRERNRHKGGDSDRHTEKAIVQQTTHTAAILRPSNSKRKTSMKRHVIGIAVALALIGGWFSPQLTCAADGDVELKVSASLELFYEASKDVGGSNDDDKFKSNEFYLDFKGSFDHGLGAKLKLDGADIVSSHDKTVTEKIVEEANFTAKHIGESPVTLVFGKDEMPFGLDYDKYLNDSIAHQFEIDKVWGFHGIVDIPNVGNIAAAAYQHRHSDEGEVEVTNELGDNLAAKLTVDSLVENLTVKVSAASESYANTEITDEETGITTSSTKDDEARYGAGAVYKVKGLGNLNVEYIAFNSLKGKPDYDPDLVTLGIQYDGIENITLWGRYEIIGDDTSDAVETDFWSVGMKYSSAKNYSLMLEFSNFNSGDMKDAKDLKVADGSIEEAVLLGVKAKF